jgi:hypothetical protein
MFSGLSHGSFSGSQIQRLNSSLFSKKNFKNIKDQTSRTAPGESPLPSKEFRDLVSAYSVNKFANDAFFKYGSKMLQDETLRAKFKIGSRVRSIIYQAELWGDSFDAGGENNIRNVLNTSRFDTKKELAILYAYSYLQAVSLGFHYHNDYCRELRPNTCLFHGHATLYRCLQKRYFSNKDSAVGAVHLEREIQIDETELIAIYEGLSFHYKELKSYNCLEPVSGSIVQFDRCLQRLDSNASTTLISINNHEHLNAIFTDSNCPLGNSAFTKENSSSGRERYIFINSRQERLDDISYTFNKANNIYLTSLELDSESVDDDLYHDIEFNSDLDITSRFDAQCISRDSISGKPRFIDRSKFSSFRRPKRNSPNNDSNDDGDLDISD